MKRKHTPEYMNINRQPATTQWRFDIKHQPERVWLTFDTKHQPDTVLFDVSQKMFFHTSTNDTVLSKRCHNCLLFWKLHNRNSKKKYT